MSEEKASVNGRARNVFDKAVEPFVLPLIPHRDRFMVENLANIVSVFRMVVSVIVNIFLARTVIYWQTLCWLGGLFVLMLTDGVDGAIARILETVSYFGKVVDPLADKVLFFGLLWGLCNDFHSVPFNVLSVILLIVEILNAYNGARLTRLCMALRASNGGGASDWGKYKFATQCVLGFLGRLIPIVAIAYPVTMALLIFVIPLAIMSQWTYITRIQKCRVIVVYLVCVRGQEMPQQFAA